MEGLVGKIHINTFEFDFAKDGGAVGDITLRGGDVPKNHLVIGAVPYIKEAVTSDGAATVALKLVGTGDVLAATGKASLTDETPLDGVPQPGTASTYIKTGALRRKPVATIGAAALTGGKFKVSLLSLPICS